ncbi:hypothetical protein [Paraburkholderia unamae]|uniref:Uncharacterized protein n=1 Tax=Paraburkholderia unamae TaxID=219649 RepID=A0ACC6RUE9_9BURK
MILSDEVLREEIAAQRLAQRREKKRDRLRKARAMLPQLIADVKRAEEDLRRHFEQLHGVEVGWDKKTGAYFIVSFKGSWKVPIEFVKLLLRDEHLLRMPRTQQHEIMVPKALSALNVDAAEEVSSKVWNKPLAEYQLEPIRQMLISHGYQPTAQQTTVGHFLNLLKAGKAQRSESRAPTSVGDGDNQVTFSSKKNMHFRERMHTVQWRGNSPRIRLDGQLVSVWTLLQETGHDKQTIIDISNNAEALYRAEEAARLRAEKAEAELDAMFGDLDEPPIPRAARDKKLTEVTVEERE